MGQSKSKPSSQRNDGERKANSKKNKIIQKIEILEQTADIFKLDIDCYEEVFDYLPLDDLFRMGRTCKRLQQVAGYCFQQNYSTKKCYSIKGCLHMFSNSGSKYQQLEHFAPFIRKFIILNRKEFQHISNKLSTLRGLKEIFILKCKASDLIRLKNISIDKLEVLCISFCDFSNKLSEIIDDCTSVKRLKVSNCTGKYNWLDRKYPTLEHFELTIESNISIPRGIPMFLERNPNIQKFGTNVQYVWTHREEIMRANIKLHDLVIDCDFPKWYKFYSMIGLLKMFHERGIYRNLHLYIGYNMCQKTINQLATIDGITKIYVRNWKPFEFSVFNNLEELYVQNSKFVSDLEMLTNNIMNLKRIHFYIGSIDSIMPFIRRSVEMRRIKINYLEAGVHFNYETSIIDLLALNKERELLQDAQKITLYVNEKVYLATKWAMKETDFGLVRLKREDSFKWVHDFENFY